MVEPWIWYSEKMNVVLKYRGVSLFNKNMYVYDVNRKALEA